MLLSQEQLLDLLPNLKLDSRKKNLIGPCPQCKNDEFGISLNEFHRFGCYRSKKCGFTGNIFTLLKFLGKSLDVGIRQNSLKPLQNKLGSIIEEIEIELEEIKLPLGSKLELSNEYLKSRGFSLFNKFTPHTTKLDPKFIDYIIFPIYQNNRLVAYVSRLMMSREEHEKSCIKRERLGLKKLPKYRNSISDFESIIFGIDEITGNTHTVILVEGILDKENVDKLFNLDSQEEIKCLCTFKCHLSSSQLNALLRLQSTLNTVYILYDEDVPKKKRQLVEKLIEISNFTILVGVWDDIEQDPGSMDGDILIDIFDTALHPDDYLKKVTNKLKNNNLSYE